MIPSVRVWGSFAALFGAEWNTVLQAAPPQQYHVTDFSAEPLRAPSPVAFDAGSAFTMEGWVFLTEASPRAWLMGKGEPINGGAGGVRLNFALTLDDDGTRPRFVTNHITLVAPGALPLRQWTHIAVTLDGGTTRLHVDGAVVASRDETPAIPAIPAAPFGLGTPFDAAGVGAPGDAARVFGRQFRFWSVARSAAELTAASDETIPSNRAGLVAAWPMDEDWGLTVRDVSGHGRHLARAHSVGGMRLSVLDTGPYFTTIEDAITHPDWTDPSSLAIVDFDSDGDEDLVAFQVRYPPTPVGTERRVLAFRNDNGRFVDATDAVLGDLRLINPRRTFTADFNRDGRVDLFIADTGTDTFPVPGGQSQLLIQSTDGRLVNETTTRLPQRLDYTHDMDAADIDGDGDLDIIMINYVDLRAPRVYVNDGNGFFSDPGDRLPTDVAAGATESPSGLLADINGDGFPDLVLGGNYYAPTGASSSRPNLLLMNDGTGRFTRDAAFSLPAKLYFDGNTPESVTADFDDDGTPDVLLSTDISAAQPGLQLLLNNGSGQLRDETPRLNLRWAEYEHWHSEVWVHDFNADGLPDLALRTNVSNYSDVVHNRTILLNRGDAHFVDASNVLIAATHSGLAVADFDRDGLPDLLTIYGGRILQSRAARRLDLEVFADVAPVLKVQPTSQLVGTGETVTLLATAVGAPRPELQWHRNGVAIPGATGEWLSIDGANAATAGVYTVVATNLADSVTSQEARVTVIPAGFEATQVLQGAGTGEAPFTLEFANHFVSLESVTHVDWHVQLPTGWSFVSSVGDDAASSRPSGGEADLLAWSWTTGTPNALDFRYTIQKSGEAGPDDAVVAVLTVTTGEGATEYAVQPDPLPLRPHHSADTDHNNELSLTELLRVIELYNTRVGTTRTGGYRAQTGSVDGFAPNAEAIAGTPTQFHSADMDRDGMIALGELLRVIELYNTRSGTTRTGRYRVQFDSADGFAPDS